MIGRRAHIYWGDAVDAETPQLALVYELYYSNQDNIDTLAGIDANGTEVPSPDQDGTMVGPLTTATTYWFNVVVTDGDSNRSAYQSVSGTTFDAIFMFGTTPVVGNDVGGRTGANATCAATMAANHPLLSCANVRAFLSVNVSDEINGMPVPPGIPIVSASNFDTYLGQWAHIGAQAPQASMIDRGILPGTFGGHFWSGSNFNGDYFGGTDNCNGFMGGGTTGQTGDGSEVIAAFLAEGAAPCTEARHLVCVCWDN